MRSRIVVWWCGVWLAGALAASASSPMGIPALDPYERTSPDGTYRLQVNPTDPAGDGPADYMLLRHTSPVWTNRLPFTFRTALVRDDGSVAGYGYPKARGKDPAPGELVVAVLAPAGQLLATHHERLVFAGYWYEPRVEGLVNFEDTGEIAIRIAPTNSAEGETWRMFAWSNGAPVRVVRPVTAPAAGAARVSIEQARKLPGRPLAVLHWGVYATETDSEGARFTLVDAQGREWWRLDLDGDYDRPGDPDGEFALRESMRQSGGLLAASESGRFTVRSARAGQRVSFVAEREGTDGWVVRETGRESFVDPPPTPTAMAETTLVEIGRFTLEDAPATPAPGRRGRVAFDLDDQGRFCVLCDHSDTPDLEWLAADGTSLGLLRLPAAAAASNSSWEMVGPAWVGGARFLVAGSWSGPVETTLVYRVDFERRTVERLAAADTAPIQALTGFPDGRFAALTKTWAAHSSRDGLAFFAPDGTPGWRDSKAGYGGRDGDLLSPEDLVACGSNEVAVLDNIRHTIQVFTSDGRLVGLVDLDQVWKQPVNYPTDLACDGAEGFLVYDFDAAAPLVRIRRDGTIRSALVPRYAGGQRIGLPDGARRAPDGALWVCDGDTLLRLGDDGRAVHMMEGVVQQDVLAHPSSFAVAPDGRIAVADHRTLVVHTYGPDGRRQLRCRPPSMDFKETEHVDHIALDPRGGLVASIRGSPRRQLLFGTAGDFVRDLGNVWNAVTEERCYQPDGGCWVIGFRELHLLDPAGRRRTVLTRRPDHGWLTQLNGGAVSPDGSLAVVTERNGERDWLCVYAPDGSPRHTLRLPSDLDVGWADFAFDGRWIYALREADTVGLEVTSGAVVRVRFPPRVDPDALVGPFAVHGGRELWFLDRFARVMHRFANPAVP